MFRLLSISLEVHVIAQPSRSILDPVSMGFRLEDRPFNAIILQGQSSKLHVDLPSKFNLWWEIWATYNVLKICAQFVRYLNMERVKFPSRQSEMLSINVKLNS